MDKIMSFLNGIFDWLIKFLTSIGLEIPDYVQDQFTTTAASEEDKAE